MLQCIVDKICELLGIVNEKVNQVEELNEQTVLIKEQQEEICACLDEVIGTEDTECPECEAGLVNKMFKLFGFDSDSGVFDTDYVFNATVNGTAVAPIANNPVKTNKSELYANVLAAVNAASGWSMTLLTDVALVDNGRVEYMIEYIGAPGAVLTIINTHNDDTYTFTVAEDGSCTAVMLGNGTEDIAPSPGAEVVS